MEPLCWTAMVVADPRQRSPVITPVAHRGTRGCVIRRILRRWRRSSGLCALPAKAQWPIGCAA